MVCDKTGQHFIAFKPRHGKTFKRFPMSGAFRTSSLTKCGCGYLRNTDTLMDIQQWETPTSIANLTSESYGQIGIMKTYNVQVQEDGPLVTEDSLLSQDLCCNSELMIDLSRIRHCLIFEDVNGAATMNKTNKNKSWSGRIVVRVHPSLILLVLNMKAGWLGLFHGTD